MFQTDKSTQTLSQELGQPSSSAADKQMKTPGNKAVRWLKENYKGYLYVMPVILGILFFTLVPMALSFYYSFFDYNVLSPPKNFPINPSSCLSSSFCVATPMSLIFLIVSLAEIL